MDPMAARLAGVSVRFGHTLVVRDVDVDVPVGSVVGLIGPNGAGKSTLLRVLATLVAPSEGTGFVLGAALGGREAVGVRRRIGLVGHHAALFPELTLGENLEFFARLVGLGRAEVDEVLEWVGLGGARGRRADQCSHGMQRRVDFARVLLTGPDLLLLDEAHAGLDRNAEALVAAVVDSVRRRGGSAVLVSHDIDRMESLVDHVYEITDGTVRARNHAV